MLYEVITLKSLPGMGPGIEIIDEAANGSDAMAKISQIAPLGHGHETVTGPVASSYNFV